MLADAKRIFDRIPGWPDPSLANSENLAEQTISIEVKKSPEWVWGIMADTSTLNEAAGYPEIRFNEENGIAIGRIGDGESGEEFEEHPWQWQVNSWLSHYRYYHKGFLKHNLTALYLEPTQLGCCVHIYIGSIITNKLGERIVPIFMKRAVQGYRKFLERAVATDDYGALTQNLASRQASTSDSLNRWLSALRKIAATEDQKLTWQTIIERLGRCTNQELARMNPRLLSKQTQVSEKNTISFFMRGVRAAAMVLHWDIVCPHCRGVRTEVSNLGELPEALSCSVCQTDFKVGPSHTIEVSFSPHPAFMKVEAARYCSREAGDKPHVLAQLQKPATTSEIQILGSYGEQALQLFARGKGAIPFSVQAMADHTRLLFAPLRTETLLSVSVPEWQVDLTLPEHLLGHDEFQQYFPGESPKADMCIEISRMVFVFTDLVGSTSLYEQKGDNAAFSAIREHFRAVYEIIEAEEGSVLKTMGDGTMAVFFDPARAIAATRRLQARFAATTGLKIKIGLNLGEALAIRLANGVDFFGRAVNLAAKFQAEAKSGEIVFASDQASLFGVSGDFRKAMFVHPAFPAGIEIGKI